MLIKIGKAHSYISKSVNVTTTTTIITTCHSSGHLPAHLVCGSRPLLLPHVHLRTLPIPAPQPQGTQEAQSQARRVSLWAWQVGMACSTSQKVFITADFLNYFASNIIICDCHYYYCCCCCYYYCSFAQSLDISDPEFDSTSASVWRARPTVRLR